MKLNSFGLIQSIIVSNIICILACSILWFSKINRDIKFHTESYQSQLQAMNFGMSFCKYHDIPNNDTIINFGDNKIDISKDKWGLYLISKLRISNKKDTLSKIISLGYIDSTISKFALVLENQNKDLKIGEQANIKGDFNIRTDIKQGFQFNGMNYRINENVQGLYKNQSFPELGKISFNVPEFSAFYNDESVNFNSFWKDPIRVEFERIKSCREIDFKGNFMIYSDCLIEIDSSWKLNDVILNSPQINIINGFKGKVQCISNKIIVSDSKLEYPSSLYSEEENAKLIINSSSILGNIVLTGQKSNLNIDQKSVIEGLVLCFGYSMLDGRINGTLVSAKLYSKLNQTRIQNFVLRGSIDITKRSRYFLSPFELCKKTKCEILQFLY